MMSNSVKLIVAMIQCGELPISHTRISRKYASCTSLSIPAATNNSPLLESTLKLLVMEESVFSKVYTSCWLEPESASVAVIVATSSSVVRSSDCSTL